MILFCQWFYYMLNVLSKEQYQILSETSKLRVYWTKYYKNFSIAEVRQSYEWVKYY